MTTATDRAGWIAKGRAIGATHIVSVCDTFDWDDYPVFVMPGDTLAEIVLKYSGPNMQTVNEVIRL